VDHQCAVAQSYNWPPFGPEPSPVPELVEEDCHKLGGTVLQCCFTQVVTALS
jgi:hypothetical protein